MPHRKLSEEARALLRQILERLAYRQLMAANIRGHGLKYLHEPAEKVRLARELEQELGILERVSALYAELGGGELALAVRHRMERIPYPTSRMELAVCLALSDLAERVAMESYTGSVCAELSDIAHSILGHDRRGTRAGEELFVAFCQEPANRPHAQQLFGRWVAIALRSLGRPGTPRDKRAVELGLRSRACADASRDFLERLSALQRAAGLALPDLAEAGVELSTKASTR